MEFVSGVKWRRLPCFDSDPEVSGWYAGLVRDGYVEVTTRGLKEQVSIQFALVRRAAEDGFRTEWMKHVPSALRTLKEGDDLFPVSESCTYKISLIGPLMEADLDPLPERRARALEIYARIRAQGSCSFERVPKPLIGDFLVEPTAPPTGIFAELDGLAAADGLRLQSSAPSDMYQELWVEPGDVGPSS
jgi:hypothetical protein